MTSASERRTRITGPHNLRRTQAAALGLLCTCIITAIGAGASWGYVRSTTDKLTPVYWPGSCTWIQADSGGTPDLPFATVQQVLAKSVANWQTVTLDQGCSYLKMNLDPPAVSEAHLDYKNIIKFRTDKWCRPGEKNNPEMCFSEAAAAITTVFYTSNPGQPNDGQILDADIELNDVNFLFVVEPSSTMAPANRMIADLENTLTHELGHFQGLDHTCWDHTQPMAPIDDTGKPIPDCNDVIHPHGIPAATIIKISQATMFNYASPGETIKRMPKADDIAGICGIYPRAKDPMSCMRPGETRAGGCNVDGRRRAAPFTLLLLLSLCAIVLAARRR